MKANHATDLDLTDKHPNPTIIKAESTMVEDLRITHGLAAPLGMLMGLKLPLDINTYAYYSISVRGRSYGIEIVRGSDRKRHKNQKFPLGHLGGGGSKKIKRF